MKQKVPIEDVCSILEIPVSSWAVKGHLNSEQANLALEEFKAIAKKQKIILSKKYHPDKIGGDEEKLKEINATIDLVMKLKITILKPKPQNITFHFNVSSNNNSTSSASFFHFRY